MQNAKHVRRLRTYRPLSINGAISMDRSTFPVIKIEIESMRHAIAVAMHEHIVGIDTGIQEALEAACKNFDYRAYAMREANGCIERALSQAIQEQFRHGAAGYEAIQAVAKSVAEKALKAVAGKVPAAAPGRRAKAP